MQGRSDLCAAGPFYLGDSWFVNRGSRRSHSRHETQDRRLTTPDEIAAGTYFVRHEGDFEHLSGFGGKFTCFLNFWLTGADRLFSMFINLLIKGADNKAYDEE